MALLSCIAHHHILLCFLLYSHLFVEYLYILGINFPSFFPAPPCRLLNVSGAFHSVYLLLCFAQHADIFLVS